MKRLVLRTRATQDLDDAFAYYFDVANLDLAEQFRSEVGHAMAHIARHPATGSRRYAHSLEGAALRFWTLNRFPYSIFYCERPETIDVIRVLHQSSDIPTHLDE